MEFISYDSLEEMQADLARAERLANASVTPRQQRHLKAAAENPTRWFRLWEDILIVGESQPPREQAETEVRLGGGPFEHELARFTEQHERGYLFGKAYSVITPEGELGSTHVSQVVWCDPGVFDVLKEHGFSLDRLRAECPPEKAMALAITMDANSQDTFREQASDSDARGTQP